MKTNKPISITILGQQYHVACAPEEQLSLRESARLLDERLQKIRNETRLPFDQASVMTALNLAHELILAQKKIQQLEDNVQTHLQDLHAHLDQILAKQPSSRS